MKILDLKSQIFEKYIFLLAVTSSLFFWSISYGFFNFRYLILILIIHLIFFFRKFENQIRKKFILSLLLISIFLIFHYLVNIYYEKQSIDFYIIQSIIYFLCIFSIAHFYNNQIISNIVNIVKLFFYIFFIVTIFNLINYEYENQFFCGGLPNFFKDNFENKISNFSFKHSLFSENSHLGMIAPGIILFSLNRLVLKKNSNLVNLMLIFFILVCYIKSSTTLFVGLATSIFLIILFNYKLINRKSLLAFLVLMFGALFIIFSNNECKTRFIPKYSGELFLSKKTNDFIYDKLFKDNSTSKDGSASSGIFFRNLKISKDSFFNKPLGWGINRYYEKLDQYNTDNPPKIGIYNNVNRKDAVNNFFKLTVEFGIFSLLIYFLIILYLINQKIPIEQKLFFVPFITTQLIRGAGYFNGGFILIILLMLYSLYSKNNNHSKL